MRWGQSPNRQAAQAWSLDCSGEDDKLLGTAALLEICILLIE
jgi:hypothetical protein